MRGVRGVTENDHLAGVPGFLLERLEIEPERSVRHQPAAMELRSKEGLAITNAFSLTRGLETGAAPGVLGALDNEGAGASIERIGVDLKEPVIISPEDEGKGVERKVAAEPDVLGRVQGERGLQGLGQRAAHQAIDAVSANDEIGVLELGKLVNFALELKSHAELPAAPLQNVEQHFARDAGENMAARTDASISVIDVDRVPAGKAVLDLGVRFVIGISERPERFFGEDDAPAEGGVRPIALDEEDFVTRPRLFRQEGKDEA